MATTPSAGVIPGLISAPATKASTPKPAANGTKFGGAGVINPFVPGGKK